MQRDPRSVRDHHKGERIATDQPGKQQGWSSKHAGTVLLSCCLA